MPAGRAAYRRPLEGRTIDRDAGDLKEASTSHETRHNEHRNAVIVDPMVESS